MGIEGYLRCEELPKKALSSDATYSGYCVPVKCNKAGQCPGIGTWIEGGALGGKCDKESGMCTYFLLEK